MITKTKSITVGVLEGPLANRRIEVEGPLAYIRVAEFISQVARVAPRKGDGYHEVACTLIFEDGEVYRCRLDVQRGEFNSLAEHIKNHIAFLHGERCPEGYTRYEYLKYLAQNPKCVAEAKEFRNGRYDVLMVSVYDSNVMTAVHNKRTVSTPVGSAGTCDNAS